MNAMTPIPVITGKLAGQSVPLVDARLLHGFLDVGRDYTTWIKDRIVEYAFVEGEDFICATGHPDFSPNRGKNHRASEFSPNRAKNRRGRPNRDYFLTLDMAKELAMVERTPRGRQARRYFIACEQQLRQLQATSTAPATFAPLSRGQRQAVNRQAWVEASGEIYDLFNRRREALIRTVLLEDTSGPQYMPPGYRPPWAR
jgi:phage anti-repressor protein